MEGPVAYLGGDLVYRQRIGVMHADSSMPKEFTAVIDSAALVEHTMVRAHAGDQTCCWCGNMDACTHG